MEDIKYELRFRAPDYEFSANMVIIKKEEGKRYVGRLTWEELPVGHMINEPTISIPDGEEFMQTLRGELRRIGYTENADKATVDATKYHLEDMRKLVFDLAKSNLDK